MKHFILTLQFLCLMLVGNGQVKMDTTVTMKYIDSLKREIADLKQRNNFLYWGYREKTYVSKVDTLLIRSDSSVIIFSSKDGKTLKRQFNILDKDNDIIQYTIHYYNNKQQVSYIEDWQTLKDELFDGRLFSAERLEYDSLGRQILSVKYLESARRTIRKTFSYDQSGTIQTKTDIIKSYALWDK